MSVYDKRLKEMKKIPKLPNHVSGGGAQKPMPINPMGAQSVGATTTSHRGVGGPQAPLPVAPPPSAPKSGGTSGGGYQPTPVAPTTSSKQAQTQSAPVDGRKQAIERMLQDGADSYYDNQASQLGQAYENQITNLKKAYNDAVAQGEMSIEEAERAFKEAQDGIYQQAYQQSQANDLLAQNQGIQNSQQMIGLQQGAQRAKNSMISDVSESRTRRVNQIRDRIAQITKQKDLDLANAQNQYDLGLAGARAQADMMMNDKLASFNIQDYAMDKKHGFDIEKMNMQFDHDFERMAKQYGYDMSKIGAQHANQLARMKKQQEYQAKQIADGYEAERERVRKAYLDKNSDEYKIRMAQIDEAQSQAINQLHNATRYGMYNEIMKPGMVGYDKWMNNASEFMNNNNFSNLTAPAPQPKSTSQSFRDAGRDYLGFWWGDSIVDEINR